MRSDSAHPGLCSFPMLLFGRFGDVALTVRFRHSASAVQAFGPNVWAKRLGAKP